MPVILVVEDDQLMLKAIGNILNKGGFKVHNAQNGKEALEMLDSTSYDVVITDLMMPFAGGMEVVSHIRSDSSRKDTCVIVVSSMAQEEMVTEAFNLGADDFLKKPVMAGELVSRIKKLLVRRNLADESIQDIEEDLLDDDTEDMEATMLASDIQDVPITEDLGEVQIPEGRYMIAINKFVDTPKTGEPQDMPIAVAVPAPQQLDFPVELPASEPICSTQPARKKAFTATYPPVIKVGNDPLINEPVKEEKKRRTFLWVAVALSVAAALIFLFIKI